MEDVLEVLEDVAVDVVVVVWMELAVVVAVVVHKVEWVHSMVTQLLEQHRCSTMFQ